MSDAHGSNSVDLEARGWACLVCGKLHPADDPHVLMTCSCGDEGWGHPDECEVCLICRLDMLADQEQET